MTFSNETCVMKRSNGFPLSQHVQHDIRNDDLKSSIPFSYRLEEEARSIILDNAMKYPEFKSCDAGLDNGTHVDVLETGPLPLMKNKISTSSSKFMGSADLEDLNTAGAAMQEQDPISDGKLWQRIWQLEKELHDRDLKCASLEKQIMETQQRAILAEEGERLMSRRADIFGSIVADVSAYDGSNGVEDAMLASEKPPNGRVGRRKRVQRVRYNSDQRSNHGHFSISGLASSPKADCPSTYSTADELLDGWHYGLGDAEAFTGANSGSSLENEEQATNNSSYNSDFQSLASDISSPTVDNISELYFPFSSSRPASVVLSSPFPASWEHSMALSRTGLDDVMQTSGLRSAVSSQPKRMRRFSSTSGGLKVLILPNTRVTPTSPSPSPSPLYQRAGPQSKKIEDAPIGPICQRTSISLLDRLHTVPQEAVQVDSQPKQNSSTCTCLITISHESDLAPRPHSTRNASDHLTDQQRTLSRKTTSSSRLATASVLKPNDHALPTGCRSASHFRSSSFSPEAVSDLEQTPARRTRLKTIRCDGTNCQRLLNESVTARLSWKKCSMNLQELSNTSHAYPIETKPESVTRSKHRTRDSVSDGLSCRPNLCQEFTSVSAEQTSQSQPLEMIGTHVTTSQEVSPSTSNICRGLFLPLTMTRRRSKIKVDSFDCLVRTIASRMNNLIEDFPLTLVISAEFLKTNQWQREVSNWWARISGSVNNTVKGKLATPQSRLCGMWCWWWCIYVIRYHLCKTEARHWSSLHSRK